MRELDPIALSKQLQEALARYIFTAVPISTFRTPKLAAAVRAALRDESSLLKGPFLESLPDFEKGLSIEELVSENILSTKWNNLENSLYKRKLHAHQEKAIRKAFSGENYLVATGTGSGKTEAFLYPVVDRLLRDGNLEKPGVRAILVYPLNALANDQLYYRIARLLLRELGDPGITFGRFTGQISSETDRKTEEARLIKIPALRAALGFKRNISHSWKLSREEMLKQPPHILITNYAMLEHLSCHIICV